MTQTNAPEAGAPLTGETIRFLRAGDLLRHERGPVGTVGRITGSHLYIERAALPDIGDYHQGFTFIGRPDAEGWIAWSGGENPVPGQIVNVKWRKNKLRSDPDSAMPSDEWEWPHRALPTDITAFRLSRPVATPAPVAVDGGAPNLTWPWAGDAPQHDEIRKAWESYGSEVVDDSGKIDWTDVDTCVAIGAMKAISLAALTTQGEGVGSAGAVSRDLFDRLARRSETGRWVTLSYDEADQVLAALSTRPSADGLAVAVGALEPFDAVMVDIGQGEDDDDVFRNCERTYARGPAITVGHIRRAAAALATLHPAPDQPGSGGKGVQP